MRPIEQINYKRYTLLLLKTLTAIREIHKETAESELHPDKRTLFQGRVVGLNDAIEAIVGHCNLILDGRSDPITSDRKDADPA